MGALNYGLFDRLAGDHFASPQFAAIFASTTIGTTKPSGAVCHKHLS